MKHKLNLCETNGSAFESNLKETNKLILSNLSSEDLIKSITTSTQIHELNFEILFERTDKLALRFQSQTTEQWTKRLLREQSLGTLFCLKNKEVWASLIRNYLTRPEATIFCKLYSSLLLNYFGEADLENIKTHLVKITEKISVLPAPEIDTPKDFTVILRGLIELADFLNAEESEALLNLSLTSFDMLATMRELKVIYERRCELIKIAFIDAVLCNKIEEVGYFLNDPFIDPSYDNNLALRCACEEGHEKMVRLLLTDSRVHPMQEIENPYGNDDVVDPLILACQYGHTGIVKVLLADHRVDPGEYQNQAIQTAIISGDAEIVELLLLDKRVNALEGELLFLAVQEGFAKIVQLLLADWRFSSQLVVFNLFENLTANLQSLIQLSRKNDNLDALELLLSHSVEPLTKETQLNPGYPQIKSALSCNKFGLFSDVITQKLESKLSKLTINYLAEEIRSMYEMS